MPMRDEAAAVKVGDGIVLRYECDRAALTVGLRELFVPLGFDDAARHFVDEALQQPHGALLSAAYQLLRRAMSDYDAHALLGMYPMHLLSTAQLEQLLGPHRDEPRSLLDCGAGRGDVTAVAAPLFTSISVTEASTLMRRRLRRRGFTVLQEDLAHAAQAGQRFDAILWLNVLDRCSHPRTLLGRLRSLLAPGGKLVVAVPLPLAPHVQRGGLTVDPEESLPDASVSWELGACSVAEVLEQAGLRIERLSRAPYLTRGDAQAALHVLDDAIFVCS